MSARRLLSIALCLLGLAAAPSGVHADGAPMWESPEGLTPGMPNTQVQMAAEDVKVAVSQKPDGVYATVAAVFDLQNHGPAVQMLTGFPDLANMVLSQDPSSVYSPVQFTPANITNFKAWTDAESFQASEQKVGTGQFAGPWFVWNMSFPAQKTVRLNVSYDQRLQKAGDAGPSVLLPVSYVLRTGALWNGTIGHAVVTMTAPDGGTLLAPAEMTFPNGNQASVFTPSSGDNGQLTWTLTDAKPTEDVEAEFVGPDTWQALQAAEAAASAPGATPTDLANSAEVVMNVFYRSLTGVYGTHYYPLVKDWTQRALAADQSDASVWEASGDLAYIEAPHGVSFLRCWPTDMDNAYQQAIALGSTTAGEKLANLQTQHNQFGYGSLPDCASANDGPADAAQSAGDQPAATDSTAVPDTLTDDVRQALTDAVHRANNAWVQAKATGSNAPLDGNVAGAELQSDQHEVAQELASHRFEKDSQTAFTISDMSLDAPGHATVHTTESWSQQSMSSSGQAIGGVGTANYVETYTIEFQNGGWIVTLDHIDSQS